MRQKRADIYRCAELSCSFATTSTGTLICGCNTRRNSNVAYQLAWAGCPPLAFSRVRFTVLRSPAFCSASVSEPSILTRYSLARLLRRIDQRAIHNGVAAVFEVVVIRAGHALDHRHKNHIISRVNPEPRSRGPIPKIRAFAVGQVSFGRVEDHSAIDSVAEARPHHVHAAAKLAGEQAGRNVI